MYGFVNYQDHETDLVVLIHGWQSSSEKFTERMYLFKNKGLHTLAVDMRAHGMAPDTPEWTAGKVIQDVKLILEQIDRSKIKKSIFMDIVLVDSFPLVCIMIDTRDGGRTIMAH